MDGLGAGVAGCAHDALELQIGLCRGRRPDVHRLVRHLYVQRILVGVGIDRDRGDAHAPAGLDHPAGDLSAIGDEDFGEHSRRTNPPPPPPPLPPPPLPPPPPPPTRAGTRAPAP